MALTAQQELFCREYVARKFNATDAYRAAYPKSKPHAAQTSASRLLSKAMAQARVAEIVAAAASDAGVTPQRVVRELAFIAFQRTTQLHRPDGSLKNPNEWDEATDATVSGLEIDEEFEPADAPPEEAREPQGHGGELKRRAAVLKLVRTSKVKRWDKVKALELFMKHFGLLKEDAPHPDKQPPLDISALGDDAKAALLHFLRSVRGGN